MRRLFVAQLDPLMEVDDSLVVLLGDLGYGLFDDLREKFPDRCINIGASEQLMIGAAAGMATSGKIPICYSITPFLLYRPFEFIRNYLQEEGLAVKLVGSGRDKDYKDAGYTHHSVEAESILSQLPNIEKFFPKNEQQLTLQMNSFIYSKNPAFMSLRK
jgi:transketolase